jgi:hypothetical protein
MPLVVRLLLIGAFALLVIYAWQTIFWTVERMVVPQQAKAEEVAELKSRHEVIKPEHRRPPALPEWSIL